MAHAAAYPIGSRGWWDDHPEVRFPIRFVLLAVAAALAWTAHRSDRRRPRGLVRLGEERSGMGRSGRTPGAPHETRHVKVEVK